MYLEYFAWYKNLKDADIGAKSKYKTATINIKFQSQHRARKELFARKLFVRNAENILRSDVKKIVYALICRIFCPYTICT